MPQEYGYMLPLACVQLVGRSTSAHEKKKKKKKKKKMARRTGTEGRKLFSHWSLTNLSCTAYADPSCCVIVIMK